MLATRIRQSVRTLARNKRYSALAVLSLALAISLNTTMYSVLDSLVNPALDMRNHEQLYRISFYGDMRRLVSQEEKDEALATLPIVDGLAVHSSSFGDNLAERGTVNRNARVSNISPNFFALVGVQPLHGRLLSAADLDVAPAPVVVSELLWNQFFPGEAWFDSATVQLDGAPRRIVGVLPYAADFPGDYTDVWQIPPGAQLRRMQKTVLRVKAGITRHAAGIVLQNIAVRIGARAGEGPRDVAYRIKPAIGEPFRYQRFHLAMIGAVVAVLLVACVNLANLQLARGITRSREFATRRAVGASRADLVIQLVLESGWLALTGMILGLVLTFWGMHLISAAMTQSLNNFVVRPTASWRLFAFASVVALLSLMVIGLVPALQLSRVDINEVLKAGAGTGTTRRKRQQYGALVVVQVGLALALLVSASLLMRTAAMVFRISVSPEYEKLVFAYPRIAPRTRADSAMPLTDLSRRTVERARSVPTVMDAATMRYRAPKDRAIAVYDDRGVPVDVPAPLWWYTISSPSIVRALAGRIVKGRDFTEGEFAENLAIIDENTALYLWPGKDPVGRQVKLGTAASSAAWVRIVGVAKTPREWYGLRTTHEVERLRPRLSAVFVLEHVDTSRVRDGRYFQLVVRGSEHPHRLPLLLRRALTEPGSMMTLFRAFSFEDRVGIKAQRQRHGFVAALFSIFAALAVAVAALGVYSVVSHSVSTRTREFGVRFALGASMVDIRRSVLKEANIMALLGIAFGLLIAARATKLLTAFMMTEEHLYESWLHGLVAAALFGICLLASYIPARRAMRINPTEALRNE